MHPVIGRLDLWIDGERRDGPENMAVDEWLLRFRSAACLRVYRWQPGWGSRGYFVDPGEAERLVPGCRWVRRWTGGGVVDHRADWTYTLVVPRGERLAAMRGGGSYRVIHEALAGALAEVGRRILLAPDSGPSRAGACFERAVEFDLVDAYGRKAAGAGQRRTREGLLHQGSVAELDWPGPAEALARRLSEDVRPVRPEPEGRRFERIVIDRYSSEAWNEGPRRAARRDSHRD